MKKSVWRLLVDEASGDNESEDEWPPTSKTEEERCREEERGIGMGWLPTCESLFLRVCREVVAGGARNASVARVCSCLLMGCSVECLLERGVEVCLCSCVRLEALTAVA